MLIGRWLGLFSVLVLVFGYINWIRDKLKLLILIMFLYCFYDTNTTNIHICIVCNFCFFFFLLTTFALFLAVRSFQIDRFARLLCILCRLHELVPQHFFGDCEEHLFNVDIVFGWRFVQLNVHLTGKSLSIFGDDHFSVGIIVFITNYDMDTIFFLNYWWMLS